MKTFSHRRLRLVLEWVLAMGVSMTAVVLEAADPFDGERLYVQYCTHCHGASGRGTMPGTPDFSRAADPNNGLMRGNNALAERIRKGGTTCPAFRPVFTEAQIMNIIAHMRRLQQ